MSSTPKALSDLMSAYESSIAEKRLPVFRMRRVWIQVSVPKV